MTVFATGVGVVGVPFGGLAMFLIINWLEFFLLGLQVFLLAHIHDHDEQQTTRHGQHLEEQPQEIRRTQANQ